MIDLAEIESGREFLRVSFDRSGRERSNDEQQDDNRTTWTWRWLTPYRETGSASRYARKKRDDWPKLIGDLGAGTFGADALVMWESSRGSRKVGEWEQLLDLCETHRVAIAITTHHRVYDPANPRDRRSLLEDAVDSDYESAKTSVRSNRGVRANAKAGRPHGRVLDGLQRVYDPHTKQLVREVPHPERAPLIERIFAEKHRGVSRSTIARRLNTDGIRTQPTAKYPDGAAWTQDKVTRVLRNPAYKGRRVYRGTDIGPYTMAPVLIDPELFDAVQVQLDAQGWKRQDCTARLLTAVARCGVCRERHFYVISGEKDRRRYQCRECFGSARDEERLDAYVTSLVLEWLARPDVDELLASENPELTAARVGLVKLKAQLAEAVDAWNADSLSTQAYIAREAHLLPQIAAAERRVRQGFVPIDIDLPPVDRQPEWWAYELTAEQRREIVSALIVSVTVYPVGKGRRSFDDADYTEVEWRR